jgi:hypothetical protein
MPSAELPEFREWYVAAVRLLQGPVYPDDARAWDLVLSSRRQLLEHFARLGLLLVVDEPEGLAYLRQLTEDEQPEGYERLPRLFRRTRLGYDETLLCVLLRDELRLFEEEDLHNERCVIEATALFDRWKSLLPAQDDEVRGRRALCVALGKLEALGFVRKCGEEPEEWEIRRILKACLPVAELEGLRAKLLGAAGPGERDRPTAREQGKDASEGRDDRRIEVVQHNVNIPEEGAPPRSCHRQDQEVDQRQRAQPDPYGRFGLGGRTGLRAGGNRRPGREAAEVGDGGRPDVVDRLGPGPQTACPVGMPTPRRIRGLALRVGRPVPLRPLVLGQQPAALRPKHVGLSIRHAAPFWSLKPFVA